MNKSQSVPSKLCEGVPPLRKSTSLSDLNEKSSDLFYEDFFEGDGPLGITFIELNGNTVIKSIQSGTVASEYYQLKTDMVLVQIGIIDISTMSFEKSMGMITKIWKRKNSIYLKFRKKIYSDILKFLNETELLKYYDEFVDLGAKDIEDLDFIELGDLVKMSFTSGEIERFKKKYPLI
tara:strand:- start:95 stop:628 length:534 start_codon:yes stop_codon:yes gene_type:complete